VCRFPAMIAVRMCLRKSVAPSGLRGHSRMREGLVFEHEVRDGKAPSRKGGGYRIQLNHFFESPPGTA
jgi:hypothetical protein